MLDTQLRGALSSGGHEYAAHRRFPDRFPPVPHNRALWISACALRKSRTPYSQLSDGHSQKLDDILALAGRKRA